MEMGIPSAPSQNKFSRTTFVPLACHPKCISPILPLRVLTRTSCSNQKNAAPRCSPTAMALLNSVTSYEDSSHHPAHHIRHGQTLDAMNTKDIASSVVKKFNR